MNIYSKCFKILFLSCCVLLSSCVNPLAMVLLDTDFRREMERDLQAHRWKTQGLERGVTYSAHPGARADAQEILKEPDFDAIWQFTKTPFEDRAGHHFRGIVEYQGEQTPFVWYIEGHSEANRSHPPSLEIEFKERPFKAFPTHEVYGKTLHWHGFWEAPKFEFKFTELTAHSREGAHIEEEWTFVLLPASN